MTDPGFPSRALVSCIVCVVAACALGCAGGSQADFTVSGTRGSDARPVTFFDDRAVTASFTRAMTKLNESGSATPASTLREQLERKSHPIELSAPGTRAMTPDEIYGACCESVLAFGGFYRCGKCSRLHSTSASGFVVAGSGVAVTSYHVIANTKPEFFGARTFSGRVLGVSEVIAASKEDDLAVVKLDGGGLTPLGVVANEPPGSPVTLISHPDGNFYTLSVGHIARYKRVGGKGGALNRVIITADYGVGSSGAPVLNECGNVVGVVSTTSAIFAKAPGHAEQDDHEVAYPQMIERACSTSEALMRMLR